VNAPCTSDGGTWSSSYGEEAGWGPWQPPLRPGDELSPGYEVVAHLRRGHRLDVYDVWSRDRSCRCVAKALRPDRADDGRAATRLRTEGRLLRRLAHPHLVRAYETVEHPRLAVVMETLGGHTVSYLVAEHGRLPTADVAVLGLQLCSGLGYLHRHRWLHLDVKPSNVVASAGRAVLLDLSLARRPGARLTGGTFDYQSPEQARGARVTAAADVWGLGATLYETATGEPPFAEHSHRVRHPGGRRRHPQCEQRAASLRSRGSFPCRLTDCVDACLEPDPADRPELADVAATLAAVAGVDPRRAGAVTPA
jgi:serine/threonine protein kinase